MIQVKVIGSSLVALSIAVGAAMSVASAAAQSSEQAKGQSSTASRVMYWKGSDILGTAKMLVDSGAGHNYKVYAGHRDKRGNAEQHMLETDVIFVMDGSATFVTGGSMIDPRSTGPNEMGGSALAGGESRSLGRGDVIIVPNGTTHWFKDVNGAINYATVKIREAAPPSGSPAPVSYWKGPEVKGGALFEGTEGAKYRVAASRRNKTGTSEVHGVDTDVVVVLDGSATFVTGGTVTEEKTLRPNEIGGAGIEKGEPHQFAKGDVIIVPAGTPHWFKNVDGVINYFSIKVQ